MKHILLFIVIIGLISCSKPHYIFNSSYEPSSNKCVTLANGLSDIQHVWKRYFLYPEKKDDVFYYFKVSDFFNLKNNNCTEGQVVLKEMDISFTGKSTSGPKGERVGVFNFKANVSFKNKGQEVSSKTYTVETRSRPYNWNKQSTIRGYHADAFTKGMREIQAMIEEDWLRFSF